MPLERSVLTPSSPVSKSLFAPSCSWLLPAPFRVSWRYHQCCDNAPALAYFLLQLLRRNPLHLPLAPTDALMPCVCGAQTRASSTSPTHSDYSGYFLFLFHSLDLLHSPTSSLFIPQLFVFLPLLFNAYRPISDDVTNMTHYTTSQCDSRRPPSADNLPCQP